MDCKILIFLLLFLIFILWSLSTHRGHDRGHDRDRDIGRDSGHVSQNAHNGKGNVNGNVNKDNVQLGGVSYPVTNDNPATATTSYVTDNTLTLLQNDPVSPVSPVSLITAAPGVPAVPIITTIPSEIVTVASSDIERTLPTTKVTDRPNVPALCIPGYSLNNGVCLRPLRTHPVTVTTATCPDGYTNTGTMCKRPGLTQISPSFLASCPSGYSNNGFACQNDTDSYIKQCSIPGGIIYPCKSGFTDMGCYCQLTSGIRTMPFDPNSCPQNTVRIGNRCYPTCPVEYVRQGEECVRPESILDNQSMSCPSGTFRQDTKCYQMCQPEFVFNNGICESPIDISNELTCPATYPKLIGSTCYGSCPLGTEPLGPNETSTSCVTFNK